MHRTTVSSGPSRRVETAEIESLRNRIVATELRQRQLYNTVSALAREAGVSIGYPCTRCNQSHVFIKGSRMYCPHCGDERYL